MNRPWRIKAPWSNDIMRDIHYGARYSVVKPTRSNSIFLTLLAPAIGAHPIP